MTDGTAGYTVDQLLDRLASSALSADEAEALISQLDGQEPAALPAVFRRLHDAGTERELHAAVMILARWLDRPVAAALPRALRALLAEPAVADLNKLAAADLLRDLGQPVDEDVLAECLRDPDAVAERALAVAVSASRRPPALVNALDSIVAMPVPHVQSLIEGVAHLGHESSAPLLAALTHHPDEDASVSAVAAVDLMGLAAASEMLAIAADYHPSLVVRQQAALTLERVSGFAPGVGSEPRAVARRAYMSAANPSVGCFAVLAKADEAASRDEPLYDVLTVHFHDEDGVRQYAAAEMARESDIEELLEELAAAGVQAALEDPSVVRGALIAASARSLAGGATALGYLAWPVFLD